jgi:hypothetical protein
MSTNTIPVGLPSANITTATTTTVSSVPCVLYRIVKNKKVLSGVTTIYDNTAASRTKIGTITEPATLLDNQIVLEYGVNCNTGLTIVTSAAEDITVVYGPKLN